MLGTTVAQSAIRRIALAIAIATLSACASLQGAPPQPDGATTLANVDKTYSKAIAAQASASQPEGGMAVRNTFIEERAGLIDSNYAAWERSVYEERARTNVGVDIATLSMTAIAAAVSSLDAKTWLAAITAGVIGSKASIDKNLYFERTMPALLAQMDANRLTVRIRLLTGMLKDTKAYPLTEANADLWAYFRAGTLASAIESVTSQASVAQRTAEVAMEKRPTLAAITKQLSEDGYAVAQAEPSASGDEFVACLKADAANNAIIEEWLRKQDKKAFPVPPDGDALAAMKFARSPEYDKARKSALNDSSLLANLKNCKFSSTPK